MTDIIDLYMDGLTIEDICGELSLNKESVLALLRETKRKDINGKDYTHEFKGIVIERILCGFKKGQVAKELGIAYRTINKYLQEFDITIPKNRKEIEKEMFVKIDWDDFTVCPECKSKNVNDLNLHRYDNNNIKNSYCIDCGTEWLEKSDGVYKVLWEFVR
jgi:orotate phosphoribosyltransferase-like protein